MSSPRRSERWIATDDPAEFASAPVGRCIIGPTYLIWCDSPELQGAIVWGELDERAVRDMLAIGKFVHHPEIAERRRVLVDCRDLLRIDADLLLGFTEMARERVTTWSGGLERQAILVPTGLGGILIAGALPSVGAVHPLRFTHDVAAALEFVDHPAASEAHHAAMAIAAAVRGPSTLLFRVRAHLGRDLSEATVESVAVALGTSTRTLQRDLGRLDTSFRDELRRARIAAAEVLLVHSDLKIDAIATQVGFGTASRMTASLRRELNVTASALRARIRG